jgi:hypothetical protein
MGALLSSKEQASGLLFLMVSAAYPDNASFIAFAAALRLAPSGLAL